MSKKKAEREVSAGGIVFRRDPDGTPRFLLIRDSYRHWGFPKGHLEDDETPADAALRETREETGLEQLVMHGPIRLIDWHFRFRGRYIHKFCHFFLFESPSGEATPQVAEGITAVRWEPLDKTLEVLSYDNARGVLRRAAEMARCLVAVGRGRPARDRSRWSPRPTAAARRTDGEVPAIAALLERRPALLALRRALPQRALKVLTARSPAHLASLLDRHLVDLVVVGLESTRGATFDALRHDYPSLPTVVYGPVRSDDAAALRRVIRRGAAAVLLEGLDEPVLARVLRQSGFTGRREAALLPLAGRLDLVDPLQAAAWQLIVSEAPEGLSTTALATRLGVSRETLSRRFGAGRAPTLKAAIDTVRLVAVGQLLGSPVWRVADAARLVGYSSESLLQRTTRRLVGTGARSLGSLPPDRIVARLLPAGGRRWG